MTMAVCVWIIYSYSLMCIFNRSCFYIEIKSWLTASTDARSVCDLFCTSFMVICYHAAYNLWASSNITLILGDIGSNIVHRDNMVWCELFCLKICCIQNDTTHMQYNTYAIICWSKHDQLYICFFVWSEHKICCLTTISNISTILWLLFLHMLL